MAVGESWGFDNRVFIESVFVQNDLSEGLEPLDAGTGETKAEAAFYERTQAALCEVDYGRFEELDRKIKEAMAALPDSYREAFVMHRFKELSYKEIAEVLDVSPQTVAYRIQQALKLLRVSLKDYLPMLVWLVG